MLNNLNFEFKTTNFNDSKIAKSIIDVLFVFISENIKNDKKISAFTKGLILSQLPNISNGSKKYIDDMNNVSIKKLLNDIQYELSMRNK